MPIRGDALALAPLTVAALTGVVVLALWFVFLRAPRPRVLAASITPPEIDLLLAAELTGRRRAAGVALLLDFAVRGNLRVLEYRIAPTDDPEADDAIMGIQAMSTADLSPAEHGVLERMFPRPLMWQPTLWFNFHSARFAEGMLASGVEAHSRALALGLRGRPMLRAYVALGVCALAAAGAQLVAIVELLHMPYRGPALLELVTGGFAGSAVSALLISWAWRSRPLTPAGRALRDDVLALEAYLRLRSAERQRVLHAAASASRVLAGTDAAPLPSPNKPGPTELAIVQTSERLLPYAVLFGLEGTWIHELARYYDHVQPGWFWSADRSRIFAVVARFGTFTAALAAAYPAFGSSRAR